MELLIVPVPVFDGGMVVDSYCFKCQNQKEIGSAFSSAASFDASAVSPVLESLNMLGLDAFTVDQPVFVPVSGVSLLSDLTKQCSQPANKITFLLGSDIKPDAEYISAILGLKENGFRIAFSGLSDADAFAPLRDLADYVFIEEKKLDTSKPAVPLAKVRQKYPRAKIVASQVEDMGSFSRLKDAGIQLFEGRFYRVPITRGQTKVSPLKANLIRLLNIVRDENFEFNIVSDIIQKDTALSLSLLRMINSPFLGLSQKVNTISHAVTILGQIEIRKWVTTSVSRSLGADKPNEITRLSLVRAKFAENLAAPLGLKSDSKSLFLMGLFSVLDIVLEMNMADVFRIVQVSDEISGALISGEGPFSPVFKLMESFERADWTAVARELILNDLTVDVVSDAYIEAIAWYSDLILEELQPNRKNRDYLS